MKKILLAICLVLLPINFANAEVITKENITWYRLHFGLGSSQKIASSPEFKNFFTNELTKVFVDGVTITDSKGIWLSPKGKIQETTIVVDAYASTSPELEEAIKSLAQKYITTFKESTKSVFIVKINDVSSTLYFE